MMVIFVAPRVGAWIETLPLPPLACLPLSHPVWVRGLKHRLVVIFNLCARRTPCGCVD